MLKQARYHTNTIVHLIFTGMLCTSYMIVIQLNNWLVVFAMSYIHTHKLKNSVEAPMQLGMHAAIKWLAYTKNGKSAETPIYV